MSYQNYHWEVVAHDYNSPYLRNRLWVHSFSKYPKLLGAPVAFLGVASRNNHIEYLADVSSWAKAHEVLKEKILANFDNFEDLINKSVTWGETMNNWTEENIFQKDFSQSTGEELVELLKKFTDMQEDEYAYGTALPTLDFLNFSFVEGNLNKILKEKAAPENFQNYYDVFTAPEKNSFAQDQEEALLKLSENYWTNSEWREDVKTMGPEEIKLKYPNFYADLSSHTKKYAWVYYVYMGPAFTEKDFLAFIVDYLNRGVSPQEKLQTIKEKKEKINFLKEEYLKKLSLTDFEKFILKIAGRVVWAKPRRKDYQSKSYYHVEKLSREIAKRLFVSLDQIRSAPIEIIEEALLGKSVDWSIANKIKSFHICLLNDDGSVSTLIDEEAEKFSQDHIKRNEDSQDLSQIKELFGSTACPGKVTGRAKIINIPEDMGKMNLGDVLVSSATTPSIVPAMKKAAAIVTDEGGLTCHAAIVSRELNIPCVVGLKVVTKVLHDGDLVEVNADNGIVKIIK